MNTRCAGAAVLALLLGGCFFDLGSFGRTGPLEEKLVMGSSGPKIAMLDFEGVITESVERSPFGSAKPSLVSTTREALDHASADSSVAGLLLRIRSPGGTVSASETLYYQIERWKEETGKPVVAYFQGLAASGGYYIAMSADEVVSHPTAITGSIGVVMSGVNVSGLMERFGIADQTFTSGAFKDAGSPLRPMRPGERAYFDAVIDDLYARFKEVVVAGRPELTPEAIAPLADGRIFTARQALDHGLVDSIGHIDAAVEALEKRIGADSSRVVVYHRPGEFRDNVYTRSGAPPVQVVDIDVLSIERRQLEPGFYYLWPPALPTH